jgi:hypothetical protein
LSFGRRRSGGTPPTDVPDEVPVTRRNLAASDDTSDIDPREDEVEPADLGRPGARFDRHSPFYIGFFGGLGFVLAGWLFGQVERIGGVLILIVVSLFLAAGLNPSVEWFQRRGLRRSLAVTAVIVLFLIGVALFLLAIVPVITDQVTKITDNAPGWLDQLQRNKIVQDPTTSSTSSPRSATTCRAATSGPASSAACSASA